MNILVSACLLGINSRYDSGNNYNEEIAELRSKHFLIPICPEQLGGLSTPRLPAEISKGNGSDVLSGRSYVKNSCNIDLSAQFIKGSMEALNIAILYGCSVAILKAKSPSCGKDHIYDGTFSKTIRNGNGVSAQILIDNGIKVFNESEDFLSYLE